VRSFSRPADRAGAQPTGARGFFFQRNGRAIEQCPDNRLHSGGIGDLPPSGRFVEREAKAQIACRRDRRNPTGELRHCARQCIGAAVPPHQRNCYRTVLGYRDNRRFLAFGPEQRGDRTDQDAAGADADDRLSPFEQLANVDRCTFVGLVPIAGV